MDIIGREAELKVLEGAYNSDQAELVAIYGRRRIGKTYLVRELFQAKDCVFFSVSGLQKGSMHDQLENFMDEFSSTFYKNLQLEIPKTWRKAFTLLRSVINALPASSKIILFFDEFPWMATPRSKLLTTLDYFWNKYWSTDSRVKIIICGSSASWIIKKIINNQGGLHNRITSKILLQPFKLTEVKQFLISRGVNLINKQIINIYMLTGGVPYYLSLVKKGLSATEIIQQIAFSKDSILYDEFNNLFSSLFNNHELYMEVISTIAKYKSGLLQSDLFKLIPKYQLKGGLGIRCLDDLEKAGFIISFTPHLHNKKGIYYKVIDMYTLFYLKWIMPIKKSLLKQNIPIDHWAKQQNTPAWQAWAGYAFEGICYNHLAQIMKALDIPSNAIPATWRYVPKKNQDENGAQIDLLFDRDDSAITICEIKYSEDPYCIDKSSMSNLLNKAKVFLSKTKLNKQIFYVMICANGIKPNMYSEEYITKVATMDDLFAS